MPTTKITFTSTANPPTGNSSLLNTIWTTPLGLIGLVTAELLKANGCNVIGFEFDPEKIKKNYSQHGV